VTLWDEIHEQPEVVANTFAATLPVARDVAADHRVADSTHVVLVARGTSDNAARYAQYLWGARNGWTAAFAAPALYGPYDAPPRLDGAFVVAISQSGASPDLVEVMAEAKRSNRPTLVITNEPRSPMAAHADHLVALAASPERSIAATKSYTASLAALARISATWRGEGDEDLAALPDRIAGALADPPDEAALRFLVGADRVAVVGRGYHLATAFELALKLQELAQLLAHPYSSADFRHGPLALVEQGFPMILVNATGAVADDIADLYHQVLELGATAVLIDDTHTPPMPNTVRYPETPEWLSPLVAIVSGQLITHRLTLLRGLDPDRPRTISKVTKTR
jgi:glucosamine--fructose-6-phosphate aminotransferase (isomerizing)